MTTKYLLSFHTIFILQENIEWIEEFIQYYLYLGFDHFYLYDNTGEIANNITNKYGFSISNENIEENKKKFQEILDIYGDHITYIKWQPKDNEGNIVYGQKEGIQHFIDHYGNESEWIAFMDLDEFLFSEENIDIPNYFENLPSTISCVKIVQKKFKDRFLINGPVIQSYECINKEIGFEWAPKNIVRCSDFLGLTNVHEIKVKYEILYENPKTLRFNHYNVNPNLLEWMKEFYSSSKEFSLNGIDDGMKRYSITESFVPSIEHQSQIIDIRFISLMFLATGWMLCRILFPKRINISFMTTPQNIFTKKKI